MTTVLADLHNHTNLCDGHSTPAQMAQAAFEKGFTDFGFSGHSYTVFDLPCSVRDEAAYLKTIHDLHKRYAGRMRIYCGMEQDYWAPVTDRSAYAYLIGAVHYLLDLESGQYYAVDGGVEEFIFCVKESFGGDPYALVRRFYDYTAENVCHYLPQVVAHFDLVVKNNGDGRFFDENDRRYQNAAMEALAACLETGAIFELNTGGVYRGYRESPYPADFLLREILRRGGRITLAADAHETRAIGFGFDDACERLRCLGFKSLWVWQDGTFIEQGL